MEFVDVSACGFSIASGAFWRFLVNDDPSIKLYLIRDLDSTPSLREKAAVDEWIASGLPFHAMRDHPWHGVPIMGGMWGGLGSAISAPNVQSRFVAYLKDQDKFTYGQDQNWLAQEIWPIMQE